MDENSSCCECLSPLACMCRYNTVETGGWFYIYVVQCLLISPWAICLIFSSSLFTQRDSHFMAFSLPLATLCVLRLHVCTFVRLTFSGCTPENVLHRCMTILLDVVRVIQKNCVLGEILLSVAL